MMIVREFERCMIWQRGGLHCVSARVRTAQANTDQADSENDISVSLGFAVVGHEFGLHVKYEENHIIDRNGMENTKVNNVDLSFFFLYGIIYTIDWKSIFFTSLFYFFWSVRLTKEAIFCSPNEQRINKFAEFIAFFLFLSFSRSIRMCVVTKQRRSTSSLTNQKQKSYFHSFMPFCDRNECMKSVNYAHFHF